ncbi:MAG TPA: rhomboid family intramembrane serine protease [Solirubrobacterales bacterium]|nr:rhomboid family intramembrane serine protease [Solirubrobacterales bacterium]
MLPLKDNIPTLRFPILTVLLIVLNVVVFGWEFTLSQDQGSAPGQAGRLGASEYDVELIELGAIPYRITHPGEDCGLSALQAQADIVCQGTSDYRQAQDAGALVDLDEPPWWVTVFTSMFLHGGILHLAGNMLFLWVFGNNIEDSVGRVVFIPFYLLAGIVAVYAQAFLDTSATVPTVGASGAVAGVLGAYALLHPQARVLTLVFIIFFVTLVEIPAMIMLGIWFILQFLPAVGQLATPDVTGETGGVAYFAHVGGFIVGLALIKLLARRREEGPRAPYPVY